MFHFVPRKVAQRARPPLSVPDAPVPGPSSAPPGHPSTPDEAQRQHPGTDAKKAKGKNKAAKGPTDQDLATLLTLSLSDHALWTNVDLRRAISTTDDGWIPLSFLLQHSAYLLHLDSRPPDSALVKAIRGHADDVLEVRMRVTAPSKGAWYGKDPSSSKEDEEGGYEIRLKHCTDALARVRNSTRNEWEERTVYLENVPVAHRTIAGIHRFLSSLLPVPTPPASTAAGTPTPPPPPQSPLSRMQTISLLAHHLDRPGAPPKCKGFALVTLAAAADATHLATAWPWRPRRTAVPGEVEAKGEGEGEKKAEEARLRKDAAEEAVRFGFRALPKARWDALKDEYLEHRQRLLDDTARQDRDAELQLPRPPPRGPRPEYEYDGEQHAEAQHTPAPEHERAPSLDPGAPYPPGCLVFVRHVHPETNKTTLKALLAAHAPPAAAALDYVDYAKGMASCHVRTSTPTHARALAAAFVDRPLAQAHGLDAAGSPSHSPSADTDNSGPRRITAELVDGERETLYWTKVPEKVRCEAVRKAIALAAGPFGVDGDGGGDVEMAETAETAEEPAQKTARRARKRRRKA